MFPLISSLQKKRWMLALLVWMWTTVAWAQLPNIGAPIVNNYDPKIYKAHSQNWVAVQDRRGIMFFGNSNGILEFDGQRWQTITVNGNPLVRSLTMAQDGSIFYGSIGDFGYLSVSPTGKINAISLKENLPKDEQVFNDVWQVESANDGVYFLTRSRIFRFFQGKLSVLPGKFAASQATLLNGILFYADSEKGICLIDGDRIVPVPQLAGIFNGKRVLIARYGEHELLVGRISGDFRHINLAPLWDRVQKKYVVERETGNLVSDFPTEIDSILNEDNIYLYKLVPLRDLNFAISTVKAGVFIFSREGKLLRVFNKNSGLLDNTVAGVMLDRSGDLWAATNSGISHIELSVPQSVFNAKNGIEGISISAAYFHDRLYVGTFQNIYYQTPFQYSQKQDVPHFLPLREGTSEVWQFMELSGDLMAASGRGLYRVEGDAAYKVLGSSGNAYCLGKTPRWPDHLFVGLMGGVEVFKRENGQWKLLGRLSGVKENIRRISTDANGDLWLNTEVKGLIRTHFTGELATEVAIHRIGLEHGLPDLAASRTSFVGGTLYLITPKGLRSAKIAPWVDGDHDASRFEPENRFGAMFSDGSLELNEITADGRDGFLLKSSEGVYWVRFAADGKALVMPQSFRGLVSPDDTFFVHPLGGIWLPGESIFRVDLDQKKNYAEAFEALIRKVLINGKQVLFEGAHAQIAQAFPNKRTLFRTVQQGEEKPNLPYSQNALTFEFSASFYEKPGTTRFQYLLEGFDKDWSEWDAATAKEYTNIPEGSYRFLVRAKNLYGTMATESSYGFTVLPPWYRTLWAYVLWILLGAGLIGGGVQIYTLRLRREKLRLEELVAERTQQLRDATLTDPLTGLRNRRFIAEILQTDVNAFVGYKNYIIHSQNNRDDSHGKEVFGLFLLDMDHFKQVNDTYGHDAGDQLLKQFAEILMSAVRKDDAVIRLGGEEFLVVLKKTKPHYIHSFAQKLLERVASTSFDLGDGTLIRKTCSIGYTGFPIYAEHPDAMSFEQGVMIADIGMYHAKHNGRNQAVYLSEGSRLPSDEEAIRKTVSSLEYALKNQYLQIGKVIQSSVQIE